VAQPRAVATGWGRILKFLAAGRIPMREFSIQKAGSAVVILPGTLVALASRWPSGDNWIWAKVP